MARTHKYPHQSTDLMSAVPFDSAEEAWFWFIAAQQAKTDGARFIAGQALVQRPCEPLDILKTLDRLYRNRRVMRDHLLVLRHYGRRFMAPDPRRIKEARAHTLWVQALERLEEALRVKNIVRQSNDFKFETNRFENNTLEMRPPAAPKPSETHTYVHSQNHFTQPQECQI
jgi:hypothetical protein